MSKNGSGSVVLDYKTIMYLGYAITVQINDLGGNRISHIDYTQSKKVNIERGLVEDTGLDELFLKLIDSDTFISVAVLKVLLKGKYDLEGYEHYAVNINGEYINTKTDMLKHIAHNIKKIKGKEYKYFRFQNGRKNTKFVAVDGLVNQILKHTDYKTKSYSLAVTGGCIDIYFDYSYATDKFNLVEVVAVSDTTEKLNLYLDVEYCQVANLYKMLARDGVLYDVTDLQFVYPDGYESHVVKKMFDGSVYKVDVYGRIFKNGELRILSKPTVEQFHTSMGIRIAKVDTLFGKLDDGESLSKNDLISLSVKYYKYLKRTGKIELFGKTFFGTRKGGVITLLDTLEFSKITDTNY